MPAINCERCTARSGGELTVHYPNAHQAAAANREDTMSMLELRHYRIRFHESERLRYRLARRIWRFLIRGSD
jgi:hypothetical protein